MSNENTWRGWRSITCWHTLSPNINIQILQTDLHQNYCSYYYSWENFEEAKWFKSAGLVIRRPTVQVPPSPLAGFVLGRPKFKSSATLVNSQLVRLLPVGILNPIMYHLNNWFIIHEKPHKGQLKYINFKKLWETITAFSLSRSLLLSNLMTFSLGVACVAGAGYFF